MLRMDFEPLYYVWQFFMSVMCMCYSAELNFQIRVGLRSCSLQENTAA